MTYNVFGGTLNCSIQSNLSLPGPDSRRKNCEMLEREVKVVLA